MSSADAAPDRLSGLLAEHAALETELADPAVHADPSRARRLGRRYAQLAPLVETKRALDAVRDDLTAARELADEDASFAAEAAALEQRVPELEDRLRELLERVFREGAETLELTVADVMGPPLAVVDVDRRLVDIFGDLQAQPAVVVARPRRPTATSSASAVRTPTRTSTARAGQWWRRWRTTGPRPSPSRPAPSSGRPRSSPSVAPRTPAAALRARTSGRSTAPPTPRSTST